MDKQPIGLLDSFSDHLSKLIPYYFQYGYPWLLFFITFMIPLSSTTCTRLYSHFLGLGINYVLNKCLEANNISDLPELYQKVVGFVHRNFAPAIQQELTEKPSQISKLKTLYMLAPKTYVLKILSILFRKRQCLNNMDRIFNTEKVVPFSCKTYNV